MCCSTSISFLSALILATSIFPCDAFYMIIDPNSSTSTLTGRAQFNKRRNTLPIQFSLKTSTTTPNKEAQPLIDLQTFLKLTNLVESGGQAKSVIQSGKVLMNGSMETRRSKKLFVGDEVTYDNKTLNVRNEIDKKGYVFKKKVKKVKPQPKIDQDGNLEFGGRHRSEEWRIERKQRKAERKVKNASGNIPLSVGAKVSIEDSIFGLND